MSIYFPWWVVRHTGSEVWLSLFQCLLCQLQATYSFCVSDPPSRILGKKKYRRLKRCGFNAWVRKIPWRRKWQLAPEFLPGKFHGQRSLVGYSSWGGKESDMTDHAYTWHDMSWQKCLRQRPFLRLNWDIKCKGLRIIHGPRVSFQ